MVENKNEYSDQEVLEHLQGIDATLVDKVLEKVYVKNFPLIRSFIKKNSGDEDDAADVFQNTILAFYKKARLGNLILNCSIQTYLYSICRNLWLDELRKRKKKQTLIAELKHVEVEVENPIEVDPESRIALLATLMNQLSADCKKILGFFYFDRMRMKEIAKEMGFANEKVAKNIKGRCMKKLKVLAIENNS